MILPCFRNRPQPPSRRLSPREAYELLASDYDSIPNPMIALEQDAMARLLPPLDGLRVADLGCGTGRCAKRALAAGARHVYAIDLSAGMAGAVASRYREEERLSAIRGDMQSLPFPSDSLDGVLSGLALGYAPRLERALSEVARVLRPGGFALLSDLHPVGPSLGWEREYRIGASSHQEKIVVEHFPYSFERFFQLAYESDLFLEALHEVPVGPSVAHFARGFRERLRLRGLREVPAVAVFLLRKET